MTDRTDELRRRILAEVAAAPSPTRAEVQRRGAFTLLFATACVLGVAFMRGVPDFAGPHARDFAVAVVGLPVVAAAIALVVLRRRPGSSLSPARQSLLFGGGLGPLAIAGGYLLAALGLALPVQEHAGFVADGLCAAALLVAGLAVVVALIRSEGRSEPVSPGARGLALGGAVVAAVGAALAFQCPESSTVHYGLGHVLPALAVVAMGGLLGGSWLTPRPRPE